MYFTYMRMLRRMSSHTRQDGIVNEIIREKVKVTPIAKKKIDRVLSWMVRIYVEKACKLDGRDSHS